MRKTPVLIILLYALHITLYTALSGCAPMIKKARSTTRPQILEPQLSMLFNDIPLPSGFKLLDKQSYSFQSGNVRTAILKYSGRASAEKVFNFFQQQMLIYNWDLINAVEYGTRLLNFEREKENCIITIEPKRFNTVITISLGPKQPIPGKIRTEKKTQKPIK